MANGYQTNISTKSYRRILCMYLWYYRKIWSMLANPDTKKGVGIKIVSPQQGHLGKMCRHLAVMATCCQHVGNFLSQAQQLQRCRCIVAAAATLLPQQLQRSRRVVATAAALLPQQPHWCRCIVATAVRCCHRALPPLRATVATLPPLRCCHSSRNADIVAATAALSPSRRHIVGRCRHSSHVAAAAALLPPQLQCCRCVVATAAASPQLRHCHSSAS